MKDEICTKGQDGLVTFILCLVIPLIGCVLAILFHNLWWLVLLAPLMVFMEGGLFLIGVTIFTISFWIGN